MILIAINRAYRLCIFGFIVSIMGACQSPVDTVDGHLTELNSSTDNFRNQTILLNILRAKEEAPLSFVSVASIATQYNANISTGLPSFEIGPLKVQSGRPFGFGNNTLNGSLQSQVSPTFNNLIGKDFSAATTTAISSLQLLQLMRDGFSRDLILSLTVSKILLKGEGGDVTVDTYPTRTVYCPEIKYIADSERDALAAECFKRLRRRADELRLDFQAKDSDQYKKRVEAGMNPKATQSTQEYDIKIDAEFCFNIPRTYTEEKLRALGAIESKGMRCGLKSNKRVEPDWLRAEFKSLVGIYRLLGEILRNPHISGFYDAPSIEGGEPMLTIIPNYRGTCFAEAVYLDVRYCVPAMGARRTKAVFAILDQLQNQSTDITKIPQPSIVTLSGQLR